MDSLFSGVFNFVNGYMGEALLKGVGNLSMVSLLRRVSKFINQYMGEALSRGVTNLINGFFVKSGF